MDKISVAEDLLRHALTLARDWRIVLWQRGEANKMRQRDLKALTYLIRLARRAR